jgi:hypothetical protein
MLYVTVDQGKVSRRASPPDGSLPIHQAGMLLDQALVAALCEKMHAWGHAGLSPGAITPQRVHVGLDGALAFEFAERTGPNAVPSNVGSSPDLAGWMVLLDKWVATSVVVSSALTVWSTGELAAALPFVTPAFLPGALVDWPPVNWARVARALADVAASDGVAGEPLP